MPTIHPNYLLCANDERLSREELRVTLRVLSILAVDCEECFGTADTTHAEDVTIQAFWTECFNASETIADLMTDMNIMRDQTPMTMDTTIYARAGGDD